MGDKSEIWLRFQNWLRFSNSLNWALFKHFPAGIDHILLLAAPLLVYDFLWVVKSSGDPPGWGITRMAVRALLLWQFRRVNNFSANAEFCFFMFWTWKHVWTCQGKVDFKPAPFSLCSYFFLYYRSCWRCCWIFFYLIDVTLLSASPVSPQVCSMKEYSECLGHRWKWTTSKTHLREVRRSS